MPLKQRPVAQDLPCRTVGRDLPVVQQQNTVARLEHEVEIVRCDDLRHRQRIERADERAAVFRVKRRGRLVHEHDLRLHGEDGRNGGHALFAAGELMVAAVFQVRKVQLCERLIHKCLRFRAGHAVIERAEEHVLKHRRHEHLVV